MAYESLLEYKEENVLEVSLDNKHWDGAYRGRTLILADNSCIPTLQVSGRASPFVMYYGVL